MQMLLLIVIQPSRCVKTRNGAVDDKKIQKRTNCLKHNTINGFF